MGEVRGTILVNRWFRMDLLFWEIAHTLTVVSTQKQQFQEEREEEGEEKPVGSEGKAAFYREYSLKIPQR